MLISHKHGFIYTKTAKTAGTSVESYFEKFCMPENQWEFSHAREEYESDEGIIGFRGMNSSGKKWYNHMSAAEIRSKAGAEVWDRYFKFCVVRNPFDKLVSAFYFYTTAAQPNSNGNAANWSEEEQIRQFRHWSRHGGRVLDRDKYVVDNQVCMDFFIRYEELENGIRFVSERLGLAFEPERLPKLKSGIRDHKIAVKDFYDAKTIEMVKKLYSLELELFGYELNSAGQPQGELISP